MLGVLLLLLILVGAGALGFLGLAALSKESSWRC